jgi:hypothetical protein
MSDAKLVESLASIDDAGCAQIGDVIARERDGSEAGSLQRG